MISVSTAALRIGAARVRGALLAAPVTFAFMALIALTTVWIEHAHDPDAIQEWASTNVHNLTHMPLRSFVASALIVSGGGWLVAAVELALSAGLLERARGSLTMVKVFASGHVIATLLTEGGVSAGVAFGLLPHQDLRLIDVGISYGAYACVMAAMVVLPRWWRVAGVSIIGASVLVPLAIAPGMTPIGHVLSVLIGLAWWPQLRHAKVDSVSRPPHRRGGLGRPAHGGAARRRQVSRLLPA